MNLGPQLMAPLIQYQALDQPQSIRIKDKEKRIIIMPWFHSQIHSFFRLSHHLDLVLKIVQEAKVSLFSDEETKQKKDEIT